MDHVVHHHEPADIGGEVAEAVEDGYEHAEVVVPGWVGDTSVKSGISIISFNQSPVKEDEFLFPEDNEGGVPELEQLGQGEQPGPEGGDLGIEGKAEEDNEDGNEDDNEDGNEDDNEDGPTLLVSKKLGSQTDPLRPLLDKM